MRVALTFDAEHPDREHRSGVHDEMLAVLAGRDVHATFFLQGRWVEANPEAARRVAADGHLVGSHSFYHARLPLLSDEGLVTDVCDAERTIRDIVGVDPRPWFRCPFLAGEDDPRVIAALTGLGYRIVPVDIVLDDWDSARTGTTIASDAVAEVGRLADEGAADAIVLLHTWPPAALDALPGMIDGMRDRGATFIDVGELPPSRWIVSA
ncbi:MAG: polysaccharide deacetylase family protein [Candidatus Limnocylindrales bacterium]